MLSEHLRETEDCRLEAITDAGMFALEILRLNRAACLALSWQTEIAAAENHRISEFNGRAEASGDPRPARPDSDRS